MPSLAQVHINQALTNFAVQYPVPGFIGDQIAPVVPVNKQSDYYYEIDPERESLKPQSGLRALAAEAAEVDWATGKKLYSCQEYTFQRAIDERELQNADSVIQPKIRSVEVVMSKLQLEKEIALKTLLDTAITNTAAAAKVWSDPTSDPVSEIKAAIRYVRNATGVLCNTGWCDWDVMQVLLDHPDILSRIQYTQVANQANVKSSLPGILGLSQVLDGNVFKNTSLTGTPELSNVWGKGFYLGYVAPASGIQSLSLVYTFQWIGSIGNQGIAVDEWYSNRRTSTIVRGRRNYDMKIVMANAGYRLTNCIV
jgi:hypothetical protein